MHREYAWHSRAANDPFVLFQFCNLLHGIILLSFKSSNAKMDGWLNKHENHRGVGIEGYGCCSITIALKPKYIFFDDWSTYMNIHSCQILVEVSKHQQI